MKELKIIVESNVSAKSQILTFDTKQVIHENIISDKLRLNQVLVNITGNAVKFTPGGGHISVTVTEKKSEKNGFGSFTFRIKDNGIGMSEEFIDHIFESFTREQSSTVSGIQGTGLGMAITKKIIDMLGGSISVNSQEGKGSEFIVSLDCKVVEESETEKNDAIEQVLELKQNFRNKKILLVEDNQFNMEIASEVLTDAGFIVDTADDGTVAVEKVSDSQNCCYDLVLMDVQMPKMDGYTATRKIRALSDKTKSSIPIIAMTANAFEEDKEKAFQAGMNGFITKPIDIEKMNRILLESLEAAKDENN